MNIKKKENINKSKRKKEQNKKKKNKRAKKTKKTQIVHHKDLSKLQTSVGGQDIIKLGIV